MWRDNLQLKSSTKVPPPKHTHTHTHIYITHTLSPCSTVTKLCFEHVMCSWCSFPEIGAKWDTNASFLTSAIGYLHTPLNVQNKHPMRSNAERHGCKTHQTNSQNSWCQKTVLLAILITNREFTNSPICLLYCIRHKLRMTNSNVEGSKNMPQFPLVN
jgi:hypothetical protein